MKKEIKKIVLMGVVGIFACAGLFGYNNTTDTRAKTEKTDRKTTGKATATNTLIKEIEILNNSKHKVNLIFIEVDPDDKKTSDQRVTVDPEEKESETVEVFAKGKFITEIQYSLNDEKNMRKAILSEAATMPAAADQPLVFVVERDAENKVLNLTINDNDQYTESTSSSKSNDKNGSVRK